MITITDKDGNKHNFGIDIEGVRNYVEQKVGGNISELKLVEKN